MKSYEELNNEIANLTTQVEKAAIELKENRIAMRKEDITNYMNQCISESPEVESLYDVRSGLLELISVEENYDEVMKMFEAFKKRYSAYYLAKTNVSLLKDTLTL